MALTPLDFPASPTVGQLYPDPPVTGQPTYRWDGAQWLSYAAASLPTPTKPDNYGKKNYIINGAMQVSQENGTTAGTINSYYPVDQFSFFTNSSASYSISQAISATPGGSPYRIRLSITTADATVAASDAAGVITRIEGSRAADLAFGTAIAKTITLQFGVKAPAGTYSIAILNAAGSRSYYAEYVIAGGEANTDVVKSVTMLGDTIGAWNRDTAIGLEIRWTLMAGTSQTAPANVWSTPNVWGTTNQFNFMGSNGNVFELFDVSLTEGSVAPPFQVPDYADELLACQRYWEPLNFGNGLGQVLPAGLMTSTFYYAYWQFHVKKRATPTVTQAAGSSWGNAVPTTTSVSPDGAIFNHGTTHFFLQGTVNTAAITANARL